MKEILQRQMGTLLVGALLMLFAAACSDDSGGAPDVGSDGATDTKTEMGSTPDLVTTPDLSRELKITAVVPNNGPACPFKAGGAADNCDGEIPITLVGQNFEVGATVFVDGGAGYIITTINVTSAASLSFKLRKQPYDTTQAFKAFISIRQGARQSNDAFFYYWLHKPADADNTGSVTSTLVEAFRDFDSQPIEGKVFVKGVTDAATGSAAPSVKVEFGISPQGKDPIKDYTFRWFEATYKSDDAGYDVYQGVVKPGLSGDFDIAMRFSTDNGSTWTFVDGDETDPKYDPAKTGLLKVSLAPLNYCVKKADCATKLLDKVCEVDSADWKKNRCIGCKVDQDCKDNASAFGPSCNAGKKFCVCKGDADCKGHFNGNKCLSGTSTCGCQQPTDCEEPNVCYKDFPLKGLFGCGPPQNNPDGGTAG